MWQRRASGEDVETGLEAVDVMTPLMNLIILIWLVIRNV